MARLSRTAIAGIVDGIEINEVEHQRRPRGRDKALSIFKPLRQLIDATPVIAAVIPRRDEIASADRDGGAVDRQSIVASSGCVTSSR